MHIMSANGSSNGTDGVIGSNDAMRTRNVEKFRKGETDDVIAQTGNASEGSSGSGHCGIERSWRRGGVGSGA